MTEVEMIGWIATAFTLSSFLMRDMFLLRALNLLGAFFWTCYGIASSNNPVVITNMTIMIIHGIWMIKLYVAKCKK